MPMSGSTLLTCLTTFHSLPLWMVKYSVCMVDCSLALIPWTTSGPLIVFRKFHMKDLCVTCCGQTPMIGVDGESLPEVLDTHLDRLEIIYINLCSRGLSVERMSHREVLCLQPCNARLSSPYNLTTIKVRRSLAAEMLYVISF